jgi:hypothetical protein
MILFAIGRVFLFNELSLIDYFILLFVWRSIGVKLVEFMLKGLGWLLLCFDVELLLYFDVGLLQFLCVGTFFWELEERFFFWISK